MTQNTLEELHEEIGDLFLSEAHRERWLDMPLPVLGGETPRMLIESGRAERVIEMLRQMKHVGVS